MRRWGCEGVSMCILYRVLGTQLVQIFSTLYLVLKVHVYVHCVHVYQFVLHTYIVYTCIAMSPSVTSNKLIM